MKRDIDKAAQLRKKYPAFSRKFGMADYRRQVARRLQLRKFLKFLYVPTLLGLFVMMFTYMVYDGKRPLNPGDVPTPQLSRSVKRQLDQRVWDASQRQFSNYEELADFLVEPYTDQQQRFYSIYRWVTSNISYDVDSLREGQVTNEDNLPDTVFKRKLAVCDGYSKLLSAMSTHAGLDIEYVSGRADGLSGRLRTILAGNEGHAWNIVKLNGYWYPVDSTWDAGYVNDQITLFTRKTDKFDYYLSDPNRFHDRHKALEPNKNLLNDVELNDIDLLWFDLLDGQSFTGFIRSKLHTMVSEI
jgi:hypothetical protein